MDIWIRFRLGESDEVAKQKKNTCHLHLFILLNLIILWVEMTRLQNRRRTFATLYNKSQKYITKTQNTWQIQNYITKTKTKKVGWKWWGCKTGEEHLPPSSCLQKYSDPDPSTWCSDNYVHKALKLRLLVRDSVGHWEITSNHIYAWLWNILLWSVMVWGRHPVYEYNSWHVLQIL